MKRFLAPLALCLTLLGNGGRWAAAESVDAQVTRLAKQSHAKYQAGDYAGAADLLLQAYTLKPDPVLLFNVAKTYEKANNTEQAIRFYQRYLDQENTDPKMLRMATKALDRLRLLDEQRKQEEAAQKAKEDAERKAQAEQLAEQQKQLEEKRKQQEAEAHALEEARRRPPPPPPERHSKMPGILLLSAGAVAAGGGAFFGINAANVATEEKGSVDPVAKPDLRNRAHTDALVADICYGVGAVSAAIGTGLLIRALRTPEAPPSDAVPAPTPEATPPASSPTPSSFLPQPMVFPHGLGLTWGGSL